MRFECWNKVKSFGRKGCHCKGNGIWAYRQDLSTKICMMKKCQGVGANSEKTLMLQLFHINLSFLQWSLLSRKSFEL